MAYEDKRRAHSITLDERCRLNASGVEEVESFDETAVIMSTSQGALIIRGSGLHMGRIDVETGEISIEGMISDICYEEKRSEGSIWSRLFG